MGTLQLLKKHIKQAENWANQLTPESLSEHEKQSAYYRLCKSIKRGEVMVLAGRPSMGTSTLALNLVAEFGLQCQTPVAYFSLNQSALTVFERLVSSLSEINAVFFRPTCTLYKQLNPRQLSRYRTALEQLKAAPILVDDTKHTVESLRSAYATASQILKEPSTSHQKNARLVVIDSAQFFQPTSAHELGNKSMVSHLGLSLKQLAQEFNVAVVMVTGVIRAVEERDCKRPEVTDVENWSELKAGVDTVALLYRDGIYYPGQTDTSLVEVTLSSADTKTLDKTMLRFDADCLRFNLDMF